MNWLKAFVRVVLVLSSSIAWGATLTWAPNKEPDLAGYRIYQCSQQPCTRCRLPNASLLVTLGKTTSFNIDAGRDALLLHCQWFPQQRSGS